MINIGDRVILINDENSFIMQEKYKIGDFAIAMSDEYEGSFGAEDMFIDVKFEENTELQIYLLDCMQIDLERYKTIWIMILKLEIEFN